MSSISTTPSTPPQLQFDPLYDYTILLILLLTFLTIISIATYTILRTAVIFCRCFSTDKHYNYYPMITLMNLTAAICWFILLLGCFLPAFERDNLNFDVIAIPFIYALITPTLIATADVILCVMRLRLSKTKQTKMKWRGLPIFFLLGIAFGIISYLAQLFTVAGKDYKGDKLLVCAFWIDNVFKGTCSTISFCGYLHLYLKTCRKAASKKNPETIIQQAFPIATFQVLVIFVQIMLEMPFTPKLDVRERFLLDICFSAASSVVVPLCTILGDTKKREMFYDTFCCCYCYCEPRGPAPIKFGEEKSRADRQRAVEAEAIRMRQEERERRARRGRMGVANGGFSNIEEGGQEEEESSL